jgi:hypothetical protein
MLMAATRKIVTARFAEGWVFEERILPPEILLFAESVNQQTKCFGVGQRCMPRPISEMSLREL